MNAEREALRGEISAAMSEVKAELAKMKRDIVRGLISALCVQAAIVISAFVWFVKRLIQ